ncbi:MAG: hypothetical protein J6U96_02770 [Elusimicrobiaceae bacterium]|nr:hypothetical protein [Elusimicrobiaceae bacterium]
MFKKTIALLIAFCMTGQSVIFAAPVGQKDGKVPLEQVQKTARTDANKLWREHEVEIGILAGGVALVTPLLIAKNKKIKELNKKLGGIEKDLSLERVSRNDSEKYYQTELTYLKQEYEAEIEALTELYDDVVEYLQNEAQTYKIAAIEAEGRAEGKVAAMQANMQEQLDWWHQFYGRMYEMQQNRYEKELNLIIEQATANETSSAEIESLKASYEEQLAQTRKELARTKTALSDAKGSLKDVEKFENLYNEQVTKVEKLEAQIKELESRAISPDELARLTKASKELERIEKEAAQKIAAAEQRATYAEGLLKTFDNPYRYGKDLVGVRMVDGVWVKQDHLRSIASAWREEAISNQGVIKILRKQIADMQKVPFSQVQGAASKENVAALRSRLKQSEAYQDIVLSARREMTVSRDALSEALLSSIERGDGEVFKQAVADLLSDTKARETSGELKQIFQQLRTAYQKHGGYDASMCLMKYYQN